MRTSATAFDAATDVRRITDGVYGWDVPDGWQQGRGAWGGLVTGGITQAVLLHEPDADRQLRTVDIQMPGPLTVGPAMVRVEALRVGSGLSTWAVSVRDATQQLVAHAVATTGRARTPDLDAAFPSWGTIAPPPLPPWRDVAVLPMSGPARPRFMEHVEFRVVEGLPLGGPPARCAGYVRFADQGAWDARQLLSIVDAWYPTALVVLDGPRPLATVSYAAHLLVDPATVSHDEPLGFESHLSAAHEGFTTELRRLWTTDGRLAVENHQAVTLIR